jgi:hypothetical protein
MDLKALESYVQAFVHEALRPNIRRTFHDFRENKQAMVATGMEHFAQFLGSKDEMVHAAAINGMMFGIFIANISADADMKKLFIDDYLEGLKRQKGENVFDFIQHKQKKGLR